VRIICLLLILSTPVWAEDWTVNGHAYRDVQVVKVEADAVTILDDDGGALLPLRILPAALQKRFHYDSAKASLAAKNRAALDASNAVALQNEEDQAETVKQAKYVADEEQREEQRQAQAEKNKESSVAYFSSEGGTAPVPVIPATQSSDTLREQKEWAEAMAIKADDEAHGYAHACGRIIQVLPEGFIGNVSSRFGMDDAAFVKCDSSALVDGQTWEGIIVPQGTYHYTNILDAAATIPSFTTDLSAASPSSPNGP
jgi:hypothetical protein